MSNALHRIFSPHHRLMPRDGTSPRWLVLGWCVWLLCSWAVTIWIDSPEPAVRWMLFSSMTGMLVVWPLLRLSQASAEQNGVHPLGVACDWALLNLVFQAVVWPLMITAQWSFVQTGLLVTVAAAWSLLLGAITAWGARRVGSMRRLLGMVIVLAVLLAEPVLQSLTMRAGLRWEAHVSPLEALWRLTSPRTGLSTADYTRFGAQAISMTIAGLVLWVGVAATARPRKPQPSTETEKPPASQPVP